ncbi:hypothetical protein ACTFIZ_007488 [Dictyostelium cf. discoideum]
MAVRNLIWKEYYRQSIKKANININNNNINNPTDQQNCTNKFTPFFQSLIINKDFINYHSIQLLEKSISKLIKKNENILKNSSPDTSSSENNKKQYCEQKKKKIIIFYKVFKRDYTITSISIFCNFYKDKLFILIVVFIVLKVFSK